MSLTSCARFAIFCESLLTRVRQHSPRVPPEKEMQNKIADSVQVIDPKLFVVNPDCGLSACTSPVRTPCLQLIRGAPLCRDPWLERGRGFAPEPRRRRQVGPRALQGQGLSSVRCTPSPPSSQAVASKCTNTLDTNPSVDVDAEEDQKRGEPDSLGAGSSIRDSTPDHRSSTSSCHRRAPSDDADTSTKHEMQRRCRMTE